MVLQLVFKRMEQQQMIIIHTLGCTVHFLNEQHTEPYNKYGEGVAQIERIL